MATSQEQSNDSASLQQPAYVSFEKLSQEYNNRQRHGMAEIASFREPGTVAERLSVWAGPTALHSLGLTPSNDIQ